MNNDYKNGQEEVPLLSDKGSSNNANNRRASTVSTRTSGSRRSGSTKLINNHITDFENVDSWGILHESDTDYDLERAGRIANSNTFIDHRPVMKTTDSSNTKPRSGYNVTTPLIKKKTRAYSVSSAKYSKDSKTTSIPRRDTTSKIDTLRHSKTHAVGDDVVIDVDALLQDVRKNRSRDKKSQLSNLSSSESDEDVGLDEEDEYNSRPSSRGSSSNSSLDDVCLVLDDESDKSKKMWPDISVLEEYSKEETARLRRQAIEDAEAFHYRYDTEDDDVFNSSLQDMRETSGFNEDQDLVSPIVSNNRERILFSKPIVTNIDVPELGNKQVNEAALLRSGRLRPKKIAPWHLMQRQGSANNAQNKDIIMNGDARAKLEDKQMRDNFLVGRNIQYPPHIISNNPEHFKFTYFRIDLDSTVHSPTISGLLQPGQTFEDLFVSSVYGNTKNNNNGNTTANSIAPQKESLQQPLPMNSNGPKRVPSSIKFQSVSPLDTSAAGTVTGVPTALGHINNGNNNNNGSILQSLNNGTSLYKNISGVSTMIEDDVAPFWLDVSSPTEEEMKVISKTFGIHPLTTEDIFLGEVREKVELFNDYYLICFRSFDIVAEKHTRRQKEKTNGIDSNGNPTMGSDNGNRGLLNLLKKFWSGDKKNQDEVTKLLKRRASTMSYSSSYNGPSSLNTNNTHNNPVSVKSASSHNRRKSIIKKRQERERFKRKSGDRHKPRAGELEPLNVYIIVFRTGVLTFHFAPTPHPINVRRRARLLRDYLDVTADWIAYALIDDITDAFGPMIELIEDEVYDIEDAILKMNNNDSDSDSDLSSSSDDDDNNNSSSDGDNSSENVGFYRKSSNRRRINRNNSTVGGMGIPRSIPRSGRNGVFNGNGRRSSYTNSLSSGRTRSSVTFSSSTSSSSSGSSGASTFNANLIGWKKKGDMLRRIGDCRKRVMSILRLLGAKADVIKGFAKRYNGQWDTTAQAEIGMYLDDIQDHIITMVSSLNHYEKLLSRSHSNYLAQINIDMTKVNNDMNDVLGKITILGTIVLPMNVITGLWGMNVLVPGQAEESLRWFTSIVGTMVILAYIAYIYTKRKFGF
ncbi:similar to Saccharomyces cerevisiae YKL064W MNR2 Vacuolar membrane protein required for magnesium homeostasis [Maudiozyma barnettii]|uniref:Similar to Saccharomyces cerevisiae YKL064W MNR2 Vacuolar membrane protein required for magnesium homeostasis n=1 Tax=Maudiozyma barnettii TaxID=61262 RepID=A0A8H2VJF4_9SACH|nr:putative Mg(2+) transporter MNR2 [Kazachstania barnettii]CAB4256440.1 similar to Saccharomyces cerevisiae YKL064W MNR2 Vacuolar membrane protein required for magnesium homeostasis [Kazachstania barnettii]CAD1785049.1 similar to Saccharomyces cerevisiae YKL064W MNR2 Vacuolar membrane protein required for magnesium homeostasis [Kazachstania barnettii]